VIVITLLYAQKNLNWNVERMLLTILGKPVEQSKVVPPLSFPSCFSSWPMIELEIERSMSAGWASVPF
jgi:hypothetical protein